MDKDYYNILGVNRDAGREEIKRAYKRLAKKYHPDINKEAGAAERFKEINEAAAVLGDDKRREQYDRFGTTASQFNGFRGFDFSDFSAFHDFDFDDIFESFFGGNPFFSGRRSPRRRGSDIKYELQITLEEAASGTRKKISIPKMETCSRCGGSGAESDSSIEVCESCGGSGYVKRTARTPFGMFSTSSVCSVCRGEGKVIKRACSACRGQGRVERQSGLQVSVPAGVESGTTLRISDGGESGERGGPSGDLYVVIHVTEHDVFERKGNDIYTDVPISFVQAAFGDEIEVPTLDGKARMTIPAGTQTNTLFRLKGKGIKRLEGYGSGDEYLRVIVQVPLKLGRRQKELLMDYARESGEDISPHRGFFSKLREALR